MGDRLLQSGAIGDNVIAILARLRDDKGTVGKLMEGIARQEAGNLPIHINLLENEVSGPVRVRRS
jgi:hypothetical protein